MPEAFYKAPLKLYTKLYLEALYKAPLKLYRELYRDSI